MKRPYVTPDLCVAVKVADRDPPPTWPVHGTVTFEQYSARYRPGLDLVLRDLSCELHGGEKVG